MKALWNSIVQRASRFFQPDPRSLAVFRIGLAILLVVYSVSVIPYLDILYDRSSVPGLLRFELQVILPICAFLMACGLYTRWVTLLCWICFCVVFDSQSIDFVADLIIKQSLFWGIFLPLGSCWSVDSKFQKLRVSPRGLLPNLAFAGIIIQIVLIYGCSVCAKSGDSWWNGTAVITVLRLQLLATPLGLWMTHFPTILKFLTFGTLCMEALGPILLLCPWRYQQCRMLAFALLFCLHVIGMQSLMRLGAIPWCCANLWAIVLPSLFWDTILRRPINSDFFLFKGPRSRVQDLALCTVMLVGFSDALAWNIASYWRMDGISWIRQNDPLRRVVWQEQYWTMFAPDPIDCDYWVQVPATLVGGRRVDLYTQSAITDQPPLDMSQYYGDPRLLCFIYRLVDYPSPGMQEHFVSLLVRRWETAHPAKDNQVAQVSLICTEFQRSPGTSEAPPGKSTLLTERLR